MKLSYIELLGEKHPLCFSLAASEKLIREFGSLGKMAEKLESGDLAETARAVDNILSILMEAGRIYCNAIGENLPSELPCRPADVIDIRDGSAISAIFESIRSDTERTVEVEEKNGKAAPSR